MIILFNAIVGMLSFFGIAFIGWIISAAIRIKRLKALEKEREEVADDIISTIEAIKKAIKKEKKR